MLSIWPCFGKCYERVDQPQPQLLFQPRPTQTRRDGSNYSLLGAGSDAEAVALPPEKRLG